MTPDLKRNTAEYLRDVTRVMRASGYDESEIEAVTAALEEQIAERAARDPALAANPAALMSRLEPADAFAAPSAPQTSGREAPRRGLTGWQGAAAVAGLATLFGIAAVLWSEKSTVPIGHTAVAPPLPVRPSSEPARRPDGEAGIARAVLIDPDRDWAYVVRVPPHLETTGPRRLVALDPGGTADPAALSIPGYEPFEWVLVQPDPLEPGWTIAPDTPDAVLDRIAAEVAATYQIEPATVLRLRP